MPIATKNNSLIIKDGRLADGCGCCVWYCCEDRIGQCRDRLGDVLKLTATISAQDYNKQDLVTGCFCSFPQAGNDRWISGTYIWPGSKYAGTFPLTARLIPPAFPGQIQVGRWWVYEYLFPPDEAGCAGSSISVPVNVRVPGDPFQVTPSTRLQIDSMVLSARYYTYSKSGRGTPAPGTKPLSEMKCNFQAVGDASGCTGIRETYSTGLVPLSAFGGSVFLGDCSIVTPSQISGSGNIGSLGAVSCGSENNPGVGSLISETGSLSYSMTLKIEQV